MNWVGRALPRSNDPRLLQGRGSYTADAKGAMAVRFVRSPVARGRILGIEKPPEGIVVAAADLGEVRPLRPLLHRPDFVPIAQPLLAAQRVTYVGEPVAMAIAPTPEEAEDLAERVFVEIDPEESVSDFVGALADGAPLVHPEAAGNLLIDAKLESPGFAGAFASAAAIVEFEIRGRRQSAMPLEARGAHAAFDLATGRTTLTASVQNPHVLRTGIADMLGMPEAELRVIAPDVGGGFGQKMQVTPEYILVVWAARKFRGSFAWIEDRRENLIASFHSRDQHHRLRAAFDAEARLVAVEADLRANVGAYSCYPVTCGVEPLMAMAELPGPYDFREYKARARAVTTNTCPMAPYRGVSRPMLTFAMERLMDCAARRFGVDPLEIRRRNLVKSFPHLTPTGITYDEGSYVGAMELAAKQMDVPAFRARQAAALRDGRHIGLGFAVFNERSGYGTPAFAARHMDITPGYETVDMAMDPSGFVEARIGASPHGQGLETTLSQLIADRIGITPQQVRIVHSDTDRTPYGWGTFASRSMVIAGGACQLAADAIRAKLATVAARLMQCAPGDVDFADGVAKVRGKEATIEVRALARAAYHQSHLFRGEFDGNLTATATYDPPGTYSNACHAAIVEVDIETGAVRIERYVVAEDAGLIINPLIADGQVRGGVAQGIANGLYEEIVYDEQGNILTSSLADYLAPTSAEIPTIEIFHLETMSDATLTKAKGLGEGGAIGPPAAIVNAICDALKPFGVQLFEIPATPQRIKAAIGAAKGAKM